MNPGWPLDIHDDDELRRYLDPSREALPVPRIRVIEAALERLSRLQQEVLIDVYGAPSVEAQKVIYRPIHAHTVPATLVLRMAARRKITPHRVRLWCAAPEAHAKEIRALRLRAVLSIIKAAQAYTHQLANPPRR